MPLYGPGKLRHIGRRPVKAGEVFAYLGWPDERMEPANDIARAVAAYIAEHHAHPHLLSAPWCCYRESTYLPELPAVGKSGHVPFPLSPMTPIPTAPASGVTNSVRR
jgi:hypothetical protein